MQLNRFVLHIGVVLLMSAATPGFAEQAPVYDADRPSDFISPPPSNEPAANEERVVSSVPSQTYSSSLSPEQRLKKIEQQVNNLTSGDQFTLVESLQKDIQALRGQVEDLTHQLQEMQSRQKAMFADIDKRLLQQNTPPQPMPTQAETEAPDINAVQPKKPTVSAKAADKPEPTHASQPNAIEEQSIYQTAYNLIKEKRYTDAVNTLQKMLQKYPTGQFAANAHYWLGELYGLMNKHDQALTEFEAVVKKFPNSPRIADAQLKLGLIYAARSKWPDAKLAFKKVINRYPGTSSAQLATEQLKQIKLAGH